MISLPSVSTELNGVKGRKFIGSNGNTLFLPFAGRRFSDQLNYAEKEGYYWAVSAADEDAMWAHRLRIHLRGMEMYDDSFSYLGFSVRPVRRN